MVDLSLHRHGLSGRIGREEAHGTGPTDLDYGNGWAVADGDHLPEGRGAHGHLRGSYPRQSLIKFRFAIQTLPLRISCRQGDTLRGTAFPNRSTHFRPFRGHACPPGGPRVVEPAIPHAANPRQRHLRRGSSAIMRPVQIQKSVRIKRSPSAPSFSRGIFLS